MTDDLYKQNAQSWDESAEAYANRFMSLKLYDHTYDAFLNLLDENAEVLEVGSGPGMISKYLLSKKPQLKILATDLSKKMLEVLKQNVLQVETKELDCRHIKILNKKFNAIVAGFCLPYLTKTDARTFISDCALTLKEQGVLYLSAIEGDSEEPILQRGSNGRKMFVSYHTKTFLENCLKENNFSISHFLRIQQETTNKADSNQLVFIAKKLS